MGYGNPPFDCEGITVYCSHLDDRVVLVEGASEGCQRRVPEKGASEGCSGCSYVLSLSSTNRCWIHGIQIPIGVTFRAYWRTSRAYQVVWCGVGRGSHGGARQHTRFAMFYEGEWCSAGNGFPRYRRASWFDKCRPEQESMATRRLD